MDFLSRLEPIGYLILGWLLGLLAPAIHERIRLRYLKERIRAGLLSEIAQLKESAADTFIVMEGKLGRLTKDLIIWYSAIPSKRALPPPLDQLNQIIQRLTTADETLFNTLAKRLAMPATAGVSLKTFEIPYVRSKLGDLELFSEAVRQRTLELLSRISIFNQQVEESRFYYNLTFDSGLSEDNHSSVSNQLTAIYHSVSGQAKLIVELCSLAQSELGK